jgi:hypothetical protein
MWKIDPGYTYDEHLVLALKLGVTNTPSDKDMPFMDTTTFSWSDTKTSFKYGKLILLFFHQLF